MKKVPVLVSYAFTDKQGRWGYGYMAFDLTLPTDASPVEMVSEIVKLIKEKKQTEKVIILNIVDLSFLQGEEK